MMYFNFIDSNGKTCETSWHCGGSTHLIIHFKKHYTPVIVQADGDELTWIAASLSNVPISKTTGATIWKEPWASLILDNLFY